MKTQEQVSLTLESLRSSVPAIFATTPDSGVSDRYAFVPSLRILSPMMAEGWTIHRASQQKTARGLTPTGSHMVVLRHETLPRTAEGVVEMVMQNSHDRTKRLFLGAGIFRKVCSNGLIAMTTGIMSQRLTHLDNIIRIDDIMATVETVSKEAPKIMGRMREFQKVNLSKPDQTLFASECLASRYGTYLPTVSTDAVLRPVRKADEGDSLWLVLNRIQENLMRGCTDGKHQSKPITSLAEQVRVNKRVWDLAEGFLTSSRN